MTTATLANRLGGALLVEGTFVPTNGLNTVMFGFPAGLNVDPSWLDITVQASGSSIGACTLSAVTTLAMVLSVSQSGSDSLQTQVRLVHSIVR